jgi:hypothetical protein
MSLFKDLSEKLAHPTSLRRELDKRMQLFQEGQKFGFLKNKRYPEFGDILTLGGMAAHNVRRHWICKLNDLKLKGKEVSIPVEYQDQPPFWDHPYLHYLNKCAKDHNIPPLFPNTTPVNEDKGIKFLSEYFVAQKE